MTTRPCRHSPSLQRGKRMACFSSYSFCILVFYAEEKVPHVTVIPILWHTAFYFPPPAKGWRSALSLQNGKRAACFPFAGFCILTFHKRIFRFIPAILMGLHSPMNPGSYSPASAQDTHTCEPSDSHGQQTKLLSWKKGASFVVFLLEKLLHP